MNNVKYINKNPQHAFSLNDLIRQRGETDDLIQLLWLYPCCTYCIQDFSLLLMNLLGVAHPLYSYTQLPGKYD